MNIVDKFNNLNPKLRSIIIISSLIIIGIIIGYIISSASSPYLIDQIENPPRHFFPKNADPKFNDSYRSFNLSSEQTNQITRAYTIVVIILSVEITLLIGLISIYVDIFSKTKAKYIIGFLLFVGVFLAKSISQLIFMTPLFSNTVRAAPEAIMTIIGGNFGPFAFFFTIFEIIAICILLYISSE